MKTRRWLVAGWLAAAVPVVPPAALAAIDPSRAQADVEAARREGAFTFCSKPHRPLSMRALALCGEAKDIPSCEGFVAACADARPPDLRFFSLSPEALAAIGWVIRVLAWVIVASLVAALLLPIARAVARARRSQDLSGPDDPPPSPVPGAKAAGEPTATDEEVLLDLAAAHSRQGEHGIALQLYLAASLRALDKRGAVRMTRDRTNGEYVRSCTDPDAKAGLREIVRDVDRVQFGGEEASVDAADRAALRASAIVRGVQLAALAIASLVLAGCGPLAGERHAGDDPAGHELLVEVLRRQDIRARPLEGSLASLPLPKAGERAPAVLVDAEETELDDETRAHLLDWVDAGGMLVLAGAPATWPEELGVVAAMPCGPGNLNARQLLAGTRRTTADDDDDRDDDDEEPTYSTVIQHGEVGARLALAFKGLSERVAWFDDDRVYAAVVPRGRGSILAIATDELTTNAGVARGGNAAAIVAILSSTGGLDLDIAQPDDGVAPPTTPIAAMSRAGLAPAMVQALVATLVLFLAVGTRMARAAPSPPPVRRAFVEHVEAMGALYARTNNAEHALAAYARFAEERLRARMPRGSTDVVAFVASRARLPVDVCERVWKRATAPAPGLVPGDGTAPADALAVLKELSVVYSAATAKDG